MTRNDTFPLLPSAPQASEGLQNDNQSPLTALFRTFNRGGCEVKTAASITNMLSMRATLALFDGPAVSGMSLQYMGYGLRVGVNEVRGEEESLSIRVS